MTDYFKVCSEGSYLQSHGCDERADVPEGLQVTIPRRGDLSDMTVFSGWRGRLSSGPYQTPRTRMTSKLEYPSLIPRVVHPLNIDKLMN